MTNCTQASVQIILIFILQINLILISSSGVLDIKQRFIYTKLNTTVSLKMVVLILCRDETLLCSTLLSKNIKIKIYRITILPVVLYGCETWSLTLRKERRLRVFENRVLRRIFGPRRDEVTGEWRKLHNAKLNDTYSPQNIIWVIKSI